MAEAGPPDFLDHYTSLQTLAVILATRRIRFSRLDQVGDLYDGMAADLPVANNRVFVSCWSGHERENVPLWNMYSAKMSGCRLRLPSQMFRGQPCEESGVPAVTPDYKLYLTMGPDENAQFQVSRILGPIRVEYSDDPAKVSPTIVVKESDGTLVHLDRVGRAKRQDWEFESEWRYMIVENLYAGTVFFGNTEVPIEFDPLEPYYEHPLLEDHIDVLLSDSAFDALEVTLGPLASKGDYVMLETLLDKYAPGKHPGKSGIRMRTIPKDGDETSGTS